MNEPPILQYCRECGWEGQHWQPPVTVGPNPCPAVNLVDCPYCGEDLEAVMGDGITEAEPTAWLQNAGALLEHEEP